MTKLILGLIETVTIHGENPQTLAAKIDTGADGSSIDIRLAEELGLGPIVKTRKIRSSHGKSERPVISCSITIGGKTIVEQFNIMDRVRMRYKVLIGNNILKQGFLIDPSK
jgi:hypothetical protein